MDAKENMLTLWEREGMDKRTRISVKINLMMMIRREDGWTDSRATGAKEI